MKKTFSKYISGFVLLLASAFLINIAVFQPASAGTYDDTSNRQQKLKMFLYAELVQACYSANINVETDNERVDSGQLFYSNAGDARPIVYAVNPSILAEVSGFGDDYWTGCGHEDGALTKAALRSWGIKATDLVCEMGYVRDSNGASCQQSTTIDYKSGGGIDNRAGRFAAALKKLTGLDINNPGNDILYMKWASVVVDSCTTGNGLPASQATVSGDLRYELQEVGSTGSQITTVYSGGNKKSESPHKISVSYTCGQALSRANSNIGAYITGTTKVAALKACEQQGYKNIPGGSFPGQLDLTACVQGALNKDDPRFCLTGYPDYQYQGATISRDSERKACAWGQSQTLNVAAVLSEEAAAASGASGEKTSSCVIEAIGWILCPTVNFLSFIADSSFDFLSDTFLRTDPQAFNTESPTYRAWQQIRNVANIIFVIGFLIIIFSQLTGMGVSNYGVKKTLPRLIIAAVLVNVSYFVAQIAIDLSNIFGYSIRDVFDAIARSEGMNTAENVTSSFATGSGFAGIAGIILTGAVGVVAIYAMLSAFLPILLAAVIALVMILFILVARQAIIILLVVLSPLAFVSLLLPNTERFFKMWRKLLTAMLLLFPIIALIFGASLLASEVLSDSFSGNVNGGDSNLFGQIIAAAVLVLPLFVVPIVLKKSLDAVPMLGGLANKWSGKANANVAKKARESYGESRFAAGHAYRKQKRATNRILARSGQYEGNNPFLKARSKISGTLNEQSQFGERLTAQGISLANKEEAEAISMVEQKLRRESVNNPASASQQLKNALTSGDIVAVKAAQNVLFSQGSGGVNSFYEAVAEAEGNGTADKKAVDALRENINTNHGQMIKQKAKDISSWAGKGGKSLEEFSQDADTWKGLSQADMSTQTGDTLARGRNYIDKSVAAQLLRNRNLSGNLDDAQRAQLNFAQGRSDPPPPPATRSTNREFSNQQVRAMGPENVERAMEARSGIENLHNADVVSIANAHGGTPVGSEARQEAANRHLIPEYKPRDPRTMPQPPTAPGAPPGNTPPTPPTSPGIPPNNPPQGPQNPQSPLGTPPQTPSATSQTPSSTPTQSPATPSGKPQTPANPDGRLVIDRDETTDSSNRPQTRPPEAPPAPSEPESPSETPPTTDNQAPENPNQTPPTPPEPSGPPNPSGPTGPSGEGQ